jgi:lipopolysaccharide/colanic/teichoic acid biosynthesis glycosyltransferase
MDRQLAWEWSDHGSILNGGRDSSLYYYGKRSMDLALATLLLLVCWPLMALIAILIKLDSPGPVLFSQERVGARRRAAGGRITWKIENFCVHKFRSMVADADQSVHQTHIRAFVEGRIETRDADTSRFKLKGDPRVTRVGRLLRKTSLDELPQLFNVIKGEMSLVGPRPVPIYEVAEYQPRHRERLAALPGITGLWQVFGRSQVSFEEMVAMDIAYVRARSLWLDIKILCLTIPAVLSGRGAD